MTSSSDARFSLSLRHAVAAVLALSAVSYQLINSASAQDAAKEDVANLSDVNVVDDPLRAFSSEPSAASFGFAKPLIETPRTVTFVSEEQLRLFSVSTVEDLARLVPGVYTTTRYGLQGGINVRGVPADFYYRGMKRLNQQGHVRTVLSAYDNIEVIKGPPSPLYGLGKIGGYANLEPKSNRAKTGKYMTKEQGYVQGTVGNYQKNELQLGLGIPFSVFGKTAGAYIVGLLEDSGTFVRTVKAQQKFIQGTASVDNVVGPFRLETGGQMQNSITSGAYFTRVTQSTIDSNKYITGQPMANLDVNGDGRVGYVETYIASPITGSISGNNQPLLQRYTLKRDANNNPIALSSLAGTISGVPQSFKDYLNIHPEIQCSLADTIRSAPTMTLASTANSAPGLVTQQIPVGYMLNPCTTGVKTLSGADYRGNGAYEREQNATQRMAYFDLIYDTDPNFTFKNQIFYDSISSYKDSWLPYGENQAIRTIEDKITATKRVPADWLPGWLGVNTLGSVNYRKTSGFIRSSGGDFDFRQDITYNQGALGSGTGGFYPNTMFWTQLTNDSYGTGVVNTADRHSTFSESGVGLMADIDIFKKTNLMIGGRLDSISVRVQERQAFNNVRGSVTLLPGDTVANTTNTQAAYRNGTYCQVWAPGCPGNYLDAQPVVKDSQSGKSWSVSLSHQLPWFGLRPYVTKASTTLTLDTNNNLYTASTLATFTNSPTTGGPIAIASYSNKAIGVATLLESGIKGAALRNKLQWALAYFEQERTDVSAPTDLSSTAEVSSTLTKGVEASINFQPTRKLFMQASAAYMDARYIVGANALQVDVNARDLGFQDIVAADGTVYPAEALLYGGRTAVLLTDPNNVYDKVPGTPDWTGAFITQYQLPKGFGLQGNVQYNSWSWGSRLQTLKIPAATTLNLGATWDSARVHLKANVLNVTDELQFRATNGTGNRNMASVLPDRRYEASLKIDF